MRYTNRPTLSPYSIMHLGWELAKDEAGIRTWFKQPEGSPTYHIKIQGMALNVRSLGQIIT